MGLFEKLKNVFFEEEPVEVEEPERVEPREKVTVAKKIETPEVKKNDEERDTEKRHSEDRDNYEEEKEPQEKEHRFPMAFDDKDFEVEKTIELEPVKEVEEEKVEEAPQTVEKETVEYRYEEYSYNEPEVETREEKHNSYEGLYEGGKNKEEKEEKHGFTPSPIISPIYGILNKNYKKEEILTKKEVRLSQFSNKKADLDLVREKAYGDLAGEISASMEDDLLDIADTPKEEKENLLYDLSDEESPTVKTVTVGDAEEYFNDLGLEYNVDYKVEKEKEEKKETESKVVEKKKKLDDEPSDEDKNLFDLIDSMYEDKE